LNSFFRWLPVTAAFGAMLAASSAHAAWWIGTDDLMLRSDIQLLADMGIIQQPVTTFPLMWQGVIHDIRKVNSQQLPPHLAQALQRVVAAYQRDHQAVQGRLILEGETAEPSVVRYGDTLRDKAQATVQLNYQTELVSGQLKASKIKDPYDQNSSRLDGSFLAVNAWNWIVSVGAIDKHWGPSWDSSTIVSNNARPVPGITFSRNSSVAESDDWLPPWTFTTSFGQLSERAAVPSAKLWQARFTSRPLPQFEFGLNWVMQYGGDGYGNGLNDWFHNLFLGGTLEGLENQMAGFDLRWSGTIAGRPYAIYGTQTADDFNSKKLKLLKNAYQLGVEIYLHEINSRLYIDRVDSTVNCSNDIEANCLYEHRIHQDGYRRYGRSMGSAYDNDSRSVNIGILTHLDMNTSWHNKFSWLQLNIDGGRVDLPSNWTQTQLPARTVLAWRTEQQWREQADEVKWGLEFSQTTYKADKTNDWQTELFFKWQRLF
jgi:hypothetical protein